MKSKRFLPFLFIIAIVLNGCNGIIDGFILLSLIIGVPVMLIMFLGGIISNLKFKGKYSGIDGTLAENIFGLIIILLFLAGFVKACNS